MTPFLIQKPNSPSPVVFSIPHGGTLFPKQYAKNLLVLAEDLWSDWYTSEIYDFLFEFDAGVVQTNISRFIADANRDPDKPPFAPFWEGIVSSTTTTEENIYQAPLSETELNERIQTYHHAYHKALLELVNEGLEHFQKVLVIDLHSFGMPVEADIIVGDSRGTTASETTVAMIEDILHHNTFSTVRNSPFSGGWIIRQFVDNPAVESIQLELNQRRYANSDDVKAAIPRPRKSKDFAQTKGYLKSVMATIVDQYTGL